MEGELVDVEQGERRDAKAPDRIGSFGMGPCIAAAVLNHTQGKAWLCHGPGWSVNSELLDDMLADARRVSGGPDETTLWLIGACIDVREDPEIADMTRADRSVAEERARNLFSAATVRTQFSDDPAVMSLSVEFAYDGERWIEKISQDPW